MKRHFTVAVYVPVFNLILADDLIAVRARREAQLARILTASNHILVDPYGCESATLTFELLDQLPKASARTDKKLKTLARTIPPSRWIVITTDIRLRPDFDPREHIYAPREEDSKLDYISEVRFLLASEIDRLFRLFMVSTNIADPGTFGFGPTLALCDGRILHHGAAFRHHLGELISSGIQNECDLMFEILSFPHTWNWCKQIDGFLTGLSNSRISRALNAFSHLFDERHIYDTQALLWSMIGLEAVFTDGHENVRRQLIEKLSVLLDIDRKRAKFIDEMYNVRSRFLHGQFDIPSVVNIDVDDDIVNKFSDATFRSAAISSLLLAKCLQIFAKNNWHHFEFRWSFEPFAHDK